MLENDLFVPHFLSIGPVKVVCIKKQRMRALAATAAKRNTFRVAVRLLSDRRESWFRAGEGSDSENDPEFK